MIDRQRQLYSPSAKRNVRNKTKSHYTREHVFHPCGEKLKMYGYTWTPTTTTMFS